MKVLLRFSGISLLFLMTFGLGFVLRGEFEFAAAQSSDSSDSNFPLLQEAMTFVKNNFVKERPEEKDVEYALIRAYLAELDDPNTYFIEPAVAASESQSLAGRYGGIGVEVQRNENGQFVLYPFEESPATRAGIRDGDIVLFVNGTELDLQSPMDDVRQALRGEITEGAGVDLTVRNIEDAEDDIREYFILFEEILVPSMTWRPLIEAPEIGYLNISRFTSRTPEEFEQAISELRQAGVEALVLDLRDNPGGLLQESVNVAGEFFDGGTLSVERRITGESTKEDENGGLVLDLPTVVLVDNRTASASEIVAGALQARDRAILIGQKTYGKGSIQSIFPLSDDSSIHVTVALWYTPDGSVLEGAGLTPDIEMIPDENGRDVELGEAIRYIRTQYTGEN